MIIRIVGASFKPGTWRKLNRFDDPRIASLHARARGLAYHLLRVCSEDGTVTCNDVGQLRRLIGAAGWEQKWVLADLDLLARSGYIECQPPLNLGSTSRQPTFNLRSTSIQPTLNLASTSNDNAAPSLETAPLDRQIDRQIEGAARRPKQHPDWRRFADAFSLLFAKYNHGAKPSWHEAKYRQAADRILKAHGYDECLRRAERMYKYPPDWLRPPFNICTLSSNIDHFVKPKTQDELPDLTGIANDGR